MVSKSKAKGNGFEREIVEEFKSNGIEARRAWGSNGNALGMHEEVDVLTSSPELKIQCKRTKKIPNKWGLTEHVNAAVYREDRGESFILFRLKEFISMFMR